MTFKGTQKPEDSIIIFMLLQYIRQLQETNQNLTQRQNKSKEKSTWAKNFLIMLKQQQQRLKDRTQQLQKQRIQEKKHLEERIQKIKKQDQQWKKFLDKRQLKMNQLLKSLKIRPKISKLPISLAEKIKNFKDSLNYQNIYEVDRKIKLLLEKKESKSIFNNLQKNQSGMIEKLKQDKSRLVKIEAIQKQEILRRARSEETRRRFIKQKQSRS